MKSIIVILAFTFPLVVNAQSTVYKALLENLDLSKDTCVAIETVSAKDEAYHFEELGGLELQRLLLSELKRVSKKDELQESNALSSMSNAATTAWFGSQYSDRERWRKLETYFRRSNHQLVSKFNILETISFRIPLMETPKNGFYYDKNVEAEGLNLYQGKRPKSKAEKSEKRIPVRIFTEKELLERILKNLNRGGFARNLKKGIFSFVGVSIQIDESSLYKNKIPTARIVIMLGAKRLQKIKV